MHAYGDTENEHYNKDCLTEDRLGFLVTYRDGEYFVDYSVVEALRYYFHYVRVLHWLELLHRRENCDELIAFLMRADMELEIIFFEGHIIEGRESDCLVLELRVKTQRRLVVYRHNRVILPVNRHNLEPALKGLYLVLPLIKGIDSAIVRIVEAVLDRIVEHATRKPKCLLNELISIVAWSVHWLR